MFCLAALCFCLFVVNSFASDFDFKLNNGTNVTCHNYEPVSLCFNFTRETWVTVNQTLVNQTNGSSSNVSFCSLVNGKEAGCNAYCRTPNAICQYGVGTDSGKCACYNKTSVDLPIYKLVNQTCFKEQGRNYLSSRLMTTCDYSCLLEDQVLTCTSTCDGPLSIWAGKQDSFEVSMSNESTATLKVPGSWFLASGTIRTSVFQNSTLEYQTSFPVVGVKSCETVDCFLCYDAYRNYQCLPASYKFNFNMMLLIGTLLTARFLWTIGFFAIAFVALGFAWKIAKWVLWVVLFPFRFVAGMLKYLFASRMMRAAGNKIGAMKDNLKYWVAAENDVEAPTFKQLLQVGLIAAMSVKRADCVVITGSGLSCVTQAPNRYCTVNQQAIVSLQTPFSSEDIFLIDDQNNNTVVGTIHVSWISSKAKVALRSEYFTSSYSLKSESVEVCEGSKFKGTTCTTNYCAGRTSWASMAWLSDTTINDLSHETYCQNGCGFGCEEPYCALSTSCTECIIGVQPTGTVYSIQTPFLQAWEHCYSLSLRANYNQDVTICTSTNATISDHDLTLSYIGNFDSNVVSWGNKKISVADSVRLVDASTANIPVAATIGEIQSPVAAMGSISRAQGLWTQSFNQRTCSYSSAPPAIDNIGLFPSFPLAFGGGTWKFESGVLVSSDLTPGASLLSIGMLGTAKMASVYKKVCAEFTAAIVVDGCYNCSSGATIFLMMRSSCSAGVAQVSSSEGVITPNYVNLNASWTNQTFRFFIAKQSSTMTITACGGTCTTRSVSYHLVSDILIIGTNDSNKNSVDNSTSLNDISVSDWFSHNKMTLIWIAVAIAGAGALVIAVVLIGKIVIKKNV